MPFENAYALIVGIASYRRLPPLPPVVLEDARDIARLLADPARCGYLPDHVKMCTDQDATRKGLNEAFNWLAGACNPDSTVFIYISCHGARLGDGPEAREYLLPVDADPSSAPSLAATAISGEQVSQMLQHIPARKLVAIFDCCHAGGIGAIKGTGEPAARAAETPVKGGFSERYYESLKSGSGRVIVASSREDEQSYIEPGAGNSLFTQHLLDALRGKASGSGGRILIFNLFEYVCSKISVEGSRQHPILKGQVEDNFPIALGPRRDRKLRILVLSLLVLAILISGGGGLLSILKPKPCLAPANALVSVEVSNPEGQQLKVIQPGETAILPSGGIVLLSAVVEPTLEMKNVPALECAWFDAGISADGRLLHFEGCKVDYQAGADGVTDPVTLQVSSPGCQALPLYSFFFSPK